MSGDPFDCAINTCMSALRQAFGSSSPTPPLGGGTDAVRLFAGEAIPLAAWNAHTDQPGCDAPFLWVRVERRYRTGMEFPAPFVGARPCSMPRAVAIEMGVARCAVTEAEPSWEDYEREAEVSFDDSWRLETAMCWASKELVSSECATQTGLDAILPSGPDGGVIAWTGTLYVQA